MKAGARVAMRSLPRDKKWFVLQQENLKKASLESASGKVAKENQPDYWARILPTAEIDADKLRTLRVVMSSQGKPWLSKFVRHDGLDALLTAFARAQNVEETRVRDEIQIECLNVLKAFMNNQFGLDIVVRTPAAINALALLFDSTNDRLRIQVLTLLSVVTWMSDDGHRQVLESLENLCSIKHHPSRFSPFVTALGDHSNIDLTCTVLTFINTLINSCNVLEDRVLVRTELMENGCAAMLPALRAWASRHDGPDFRSLEAQIEVFETERTADARDTLRGTVDLSNADEVRPSLGAAL